MNVLIVDDNKLNLELFCHMLSMLDTVVARPMADPVAALAWCEHNTPDLVLLDYMMPELDGLEFLRRFRALAGKQEVPVVMVTADTEVAVRHEALRLSANDFLTKPVNHAELNARVGNLLALRRAQLQLAERADWLSHAVRKATPMWWRVNTRRSAGCRAPPNIAIRRLAATCCGWQPMPA